jgi:poly-beta-hydroxyalkanoate depolymerase
MTRPPIAGKQIPCRRLAGVRQSMVHRTPFCTLLRFEKDLPTAQPRALWSPGHFATLLRGIVPTLLPDHDVCLTD